MCGPCTAQPTDKAGAQGQRRVLWRDQVEARRINGVFGQPYDLVLKALGDLAGGVARSGNDQCRGRMGAAQLRVQLVDAADIGQPFAFAPPFRIEAPGPGHAAVQRPQHEGHTCRRHLGRQGRGRRWRQRRDAMHDVEPLGTDVIAETLPDKAFEIGIAQRGDGGDGSPAAALAHAQNLGGAVHGGSDGLAVDGGKVATLDHAGAQESVAIADLGDDMHVGLAMQRRGQRPADQRDRDPFRVGRFGDHQDPWSRQGHPEASSLDLERAGAMADNRETLADSDGLGHRPDRKIAPIFTVPRCG